MAETRELRIVNFKTREVVKCIDVTHRSEHYVEKCEMGMLRNLNTEKYFVEDSKYADAEATDD